MSANLRLSLGLVSSIGCVTVIQIQKKQQTFRDLEGREPPQTLRQASHDLYFARFFPCTAGTFSLWHGYCIFVLL